MISERDIARVDVEQGVARRNAEHFRNVQCVCPSVVKQLLQMFVVFSHDLLIEIRNLVGQSEEVIMEPDLKSPSKTAGWTYAEIEVLDGSRVLRPTHICADEIIFREAPILQSGEISITVTNGDRKTTRTAIVLPHDMGSARVPIKLIKAELAAPANLTA